MCVCKEDDVGRNERVGLMLSVDSYMNGVVTVTTFITLMSCGDGDPSRLKELGPCGSSIDDGTTHLLNELSWRIILLAAYTAITYKPLHSDGTAISISEDSTTDTVDAVRQDSNLVLPDLYLRI